MFHLNRNPKSEQAFILIKRAKKRSLHNLAEKNLPKNIRLLIIISLLICFGIFSLWGIWKYWDYRSDRIARENYAQGLRDLAAGNFDDASKKLEKSLENGDNRTDALIKLGVSKYNQKDYAGAIESYLKALGDDPLNVTANNGLGNIYRDQKEFQKAQEQYEKTIQINPLYAPAYTNLSIMLIDLDRKKEAGEIVKRGIEKLPGSSELKNIETLLRS